MRHATSPSASPPRCARPRPGGRTRRRRGPRSARSPRRARCRRRPARSRPAPARRTRRASPGASASPAGCSPRLPVSSAVESSPAAEGRDARERRPGRRAGPWPPRASRGPVAPRRAAAGRPSRASPGARWRLPPGRKRPRHCGGDAVLGGADPRPDSCDRRGGHRLCGWSTTLFRSGLEGARRPVAETEQRAQCSARDDQPAERAARISAEEGEIVTASRPRRVSLAPDPAT